MYMMGMVTTQAVSRHTLDEIRIRFSRLSSIDRSIEKKICPPLGRANPLVVGLNHLHKPIA
jgi:hypothetical protein